jgi:hypothetical protein
LLGLMALKTFPAAVLAALVLAAPASAADPCTGWSVREVAAGLGSLENIEFDGTGGLLISASARKAVERIAADGKVTTVASGLEAPGGLRVIGDVLYATTGDSAQSGLLGRADGTLERIELASGRRTTVASGLTMPNGLAVLPDGSFVTSRDLGSGTGITRVPAAGGAPQPGWAMIDDTNGMGVDPTGTWLYVVETFTRESAVRCVRIADPARIEVVTQLGDPGPKGLDDMTVDGAGILFHAANLTGEVIRLDPVTKASCVVATGITNASAVKQGRGPGWSPTSLYTVGFDGVVRELRGPPGAVTPPPAAAVKPRQRRRVCHVSKRSHRRVCFYRTR